MNTPVLDPAPLRALLGSEPALLEELLQQFAGELEALLEQLRQATARGDAERVHALAHRLKSSSRAVGAAVLAQACEQLEQHARCAVRLDGAAPAQLQARLEPLLEHADAVRQALQLRARRD